MSSSQDRRRRRQWEDDAAAFWPAMYRYQALPPNVWSRCLSYLPPDELFESALMLPLAAGESTDSVAEHAAWLCVSSYIETAENYWKETTTSTTSKTKTNTIAAASKTPGDSGEDAVALELHGIVSEDTSIVGKLLRTNGRWNVSGPIHLPLRLIRFRDETWQGLYHLLYQILRSIIRQIPARRQSNVLSGNESLFFDKFGGIYDSHGGLYDKEATALAVRLLLGAPKLVACRMSDAKRQRLDVIAGCCLDNIAGYPSIMRHYHLALQLKHEGFVTYASDVMQKTRSKNDIEKDDANYRRENEDDDGSSYESPTTSISRLSIDGMIIDSTILVDRLYSESPVAYNKGIDINIDAEETLAFIVRGGRRAVEAAEEYLRKHQSSGSKEFTNHNNNNNNTMRIPSSTSLKSIATNGDDNDYPNHSRKRRRTMVPAVAASASQPQPPTESLFATDALRCIHAKLALGKAVCLLAQYTGMAVKNIHQLGKNVRPRTKKPTHRARAPSMIVDMADRAIPDDSKRDKLVAEDKSILQTMSNHPEFCQKIEWSELFFGESFRQLREALAICEEQRKQAQPRIGNDPGTTVRDLIGVAINDLLRANSELLYCRARASNYFCKKLNTEHYIRLSITENHQNFRRMVEEMLRIVNRDDRSVPRNREAIHAYILDSLMRCGRDIGKYCSFAKKVGVDLELDDDADDDDDSSHHHEAAAHRELLFLGSAHLVAIYKHGSFHPTTRYIRRHEETLFGTAAPSTAFAENGGITVLLAERYKTVKTWLGKEYGEHYSESEDASTSSETTKT